MGGHCSPHRGQHPHFGVNGLDVAHGPSISRTRSRTGRYFEPGVSDDAKETDMAGKFELYKDKAGEFRFRLKAGNGETIAAGEGYKTKASALNGIESVKKNAADAAVVDLTE
jgi:uncharacterized protein YegP (UPF0339 family)